MLKNAALDAKIGVDTAENEPQKVSEKWGLYRTPLVICERPLIFEKLWRLVFRRLKPTGSNRSHGCLRAEACCQMQSRR